mgnify:CR=1 FL=1
MTARCPTFSKTYFFSIGTKSRTTLPSPSWNGYAKTRAWARPSATTRVNDLIELIRGVDVLLLFQAPEDVDYLVATCDRAFPPAEQIDRLRAAMLSAYRRQYIGSGTQRPISAKCSEGWSAGIRRPESVPNLRPIMQ